MGLWTKISNQGVESINLSQWEARNLRFMNSMTFILACAMVFFVIMGLSIDITEALPQLTAAFCVTLLFYLVRKLTPLIIAKIYFCIIPLFIVAMFSISIVGEVGNDKYFMVVCLIIPLIVFREKKFYIPFLIINVGTFFLISWSQTFVSPAVSLPASQLEYYINTNAVVIFMFTFFLLSLFKKEIFDYQLKTQLQKELIEEHSEEVRQSIEYAKKIQEAILPPKSFIDENLPNSFILYKPKDIVAGDFYWMEKIDGKILFACADCTGHGVPGAMVSVVCCNALHNAVNEFGMKTPADILDKTRDLVIETFQKSDREVKDGMDVSLCSLDLKTNTLIFSGANNGLYILRNGELMETKPDKQPVGNYENAKPFTNHTIQLEKDDLIYLFTDGFADQFGGEKGKKYKYKPFKQFLVNLREQPITEHGKLIDKEFDLWRGDLEQIDDVCIVGVKI
jgi:serine phosphatase RsbU (regulator of sigma subunit)